MNLYSAGAAVALAGFGLRGASGSRRYWLVAAGASAAFAIAVFLASKRTLSVNFLFWYLVASTAVAGGALLRRVSPLPFLAFCASDVLLIAGLFFYRQDSLTWRLPGPGLWGTSGFLIAAAALVRLAAPAMASDRVAGTEALKIKPGVADGALLASGWWQGVFLAAWAGGSARRELVFGAVALWLLSALMRRGKVSGLCLGGGAVALAAAVGAGNLTVATLGFAGTAFALGETVIPLWAMAALPLSVLTTVPLQPDPPVLAPLLVAGLAAAGLRAGSASVPSGLLAGPLGAAVVAATGLAAAGSAPWLVYGAAASGLFVASATRFAPAPPASAAAWGPARRAVVWVGVAVLSVGWGLFLLSVLTGLRAGFLY